MTGIRQVKVHLQSEFERYLGWNLREHYKT